MQLPKIRLAASLVTAAAAAAIIAGLASYAAPTGVKLAGAKVDNFMLSDQTGFGHELTYYRNSAAVVIVASAPNDATSAKAGTAVKKLRDAFAGKNVAFLMLDSTPASKQFEGRLGSAEIPVLWDELQLVGRSLGVTKTGEAFVINPKTWTIAYHGPIDDSFAQKKTKNANLTEALNAVLAGQAPPVVEAAVKGSEIAFPDRKKAAEFKKISYANDIAPILAEKCVVCHTPGGMAPFAMNSYEVVKGFSPMIREALRTGRMPPFYVDTHGASFANDIRPTTEQLKTLVNWIEAGAPRGTGEDPLPKAAKPAPQWPMGQPDLIIPLPEYNVPASGKIDLLSRSVPNTLTEGKWVKAVAWANVSPTVHHSLAGWIPEVRSDGQGFSWDPAMGGYVPGGAPSFTTPANTGVYIPPGGSWAYAMHYTATGKAMTDKSLAGYYFYKDNEKPNKILRQAMIADQGIDLKAGQNGYHVTAYVQFPADAELFGIQPHCHDRCVSTKLTMRLPDGTEKVLVNQPRWHFPWQRQFDLDQLIKVPKGTLFYADYIYDNTANNTVNPDPKADVTYGEQSWDEMLNTFLRYRFVDETADKPRNDLAMLMQMSSTFGAFDDDRDGEISPADLKGGMMLAGLRNNFSAADANKNGKLNVEEFGAAMATMQRARGVGPRSAEAVNKPQ